MGKEKAVVRQLFDIAQKKNFALEQMEERFSEYDSSFKGFGLKMVQDKGAFGFQWIW